MALSFSFDPSKGETPDMLKRRRELADAIMGRTGFGRAQNVGEGLGHILTGVGLGFRNRQLDRAQAAGEASANPIKEAIRNRLMGGAQPAPSSTAGTPPDAATDYSSPAAPQKFNGSQQDFVNMLMPAAMEASQRTGIDPRIIVAQAAQETGWGRSAPGNNYFGIKSHGKSGGQTFTTHEVINGKRVKINDSFRQFGSPAESVMGYADFMMENPRYGKMRSAQGLDAQLSALQASGYATDPNYSRSVGSIARGIQMPEMAQAQPQQPVQVASLDPSVGMPAPQDAPGAGDDAQAWMTGRANQIKADNAAYRQANPNTPTVESLMGGQAPAPQMPPRQQVQDRPIAQPQPIQQPAPMQMAQANPADMQVYFDALSNPWVDENTKRFAAMMIEQQQGNANKARDEQNWYQRQQWSMEQERADPAYQLDLDYKRAQIGKLGREGNTPELGLNPQYGVDAQGNPVLLQLGKDGQVVQSQMPDGVSLSKEPIKLDAGTHFVLLDPISRQPVGQIPKENREAARETAIGTNEGKSLAEARADLGGAEQNAGMILGMIDNLDQDPYLDRMLGPIDSRLPNVSADAARVQSKMDQIQGQTFLQAFESLKGAGQITEIEGQKATEALSRLNTAQRPEDYRQALEELRNIVRAGVARSRGRAGQTSPQPSSEGGWNDVGGIRIRKKQ